MPWLWTYNRVTYRRRRLIVAIAYLIIHVVERRRSAPPKQPSSKEEFSALLPLLRRLCDYYGSSIDNFTLRPSERATTMWMIAGLWGRSFGIIGILISGGSEIERSSRVPVRQQPALAGESSIVSLSGFLSQFGTPPMSGARVGQRIISGYWV